MEFYGCQSVSGFSGIKHAHLTHIGSCGKTIHLIYLIVILANRSPVFPIRFQRTSFFQRGFMMKFIDRFVDSVVSHYLLTTVILLLITAPMAYLYFQSKQENSIEGFFFKDDPILLQYQQQLLQKQIVN